SKLLKPLTLLQLKLQQRRTREELVSQGIMPPLKSPAAFHEQRRSLERARTEDYLKRKIRSRPTRSELVKMHILEETCAEASLQAKQLMLKKARLADDLNDKLSQRPGPMELIEKNIIPIDSGIKQAVLEVRNSSCEEDSSDALSPDHLVNQDSTNKDSPLGSAPLSASPDAPARDPSPSQVHKHTQAHTKNNGSKAAADRSKKQRDSKPKVRKLNFHQYIPPDQKTEREAPQPLDSSNSRLLHQQQLFLQLQIISQQHSNYPAILPAPPRPPGEQKGSSNSGSSSTKKAPPPQPPSTNTNSPSHHTLISIPLPPLPSKLDELKVAELKHELKIRGLTVSGTKNDLIERLKNFHEQNGGSDPPNNTGGPSVPAASNTCMSQPPQQQQLTVQPSASNTILHQSGHTGMLVATLPLVTTVGRGGAPSAVQPQLMQFGSCSPSSPLSPTHSEHSLAGTSPDDHTCNGDAFGEMVSSPLTQLSLQPSPPTPPTIHIIDELPPALPSATHGPSHPFLATAPSEDKDWMLQEKDRRIAELTRMLQQKQQLVERLRSQLQDQQTGCVAFTPHPLIKVKEEPQDIPMEDVSQVFISQHSGAPSSFPVGSHKPNSSQTMLTDSNGNHFLLKPTNHNTNNQANNSSQNRMTNRVTPQVPGRGGTMKSGRIQKIDNLFDILVQSGGKFPPLSPSPSPLHLSPPTPSIPDTPLGASLPSEEPPFQEEFNSCSTINGRLEDFLESTTGKPLLGVEPGGHVTLIDELHSQLLSTPSILDHPSSPMDTYEFGLTSSRTGLELAESALDSMDWLDLGIGGSVGDGPSTMSLNGHAPTSVFSTDFLDSSDLHLHWDC
uniref:SAP domain-containing protein n=1 Tax=Pygocentrus nattereri TaxID=42514 RepID=A0AAR2IPF6_PYGNA